MQKITAKLKLRRKLDAALISIMSAHQSVSSESVFGSPAESALLIGFRGDCSSSVLSGKLEWELRPTWKHEIEGTQFQIYSVRSHKYWLRGLIRRHR